jgi:hypothetical protein
MTSLPAPDPEQALARYEAALHSKDLEIIEPLIDADACLVFSQGTCFDREAIKGAIQSTFATVEEDIFQMSDIRWIHRSTETALCTFRFTWSIKSGGLSFSGKGRGL